jgi:hypothetical protein
MPDNLTEILVVLSLVANAYLFWQLLLTSEDLDELEAFTFTALHKISKDLENLKDETDRNTSARLERGDQG